MIRVTAPGRCGLIGNPSDGYGGSMISCALAERAMVEIHPAPDLSVDICGCAQDLPDEASLEFDGSFADVARAVFRFFSAERSRLRFHLVGCTTIPIEAGLAGSSTMLLCILAGVLRALNLNLNPYELAETARHIEFEILGCVCGFQDHYMSTFGGVNFIDFRGKDPLNQDGPVYATVEPLEPFLWTLPFVLANTGIRRNSGSVHGGLRERWIAGEPAVVEGYATAANLARAGKSALLAGDWPAFGDLMNRNHAIQRDLGASGEANEKLIGAALAAGALGAKLAGAGRGGTIIALHPEPERLGSILREAGADRVLLVKPSSGIVVEGSL